MKCKICGSTETIDNGTACAQCGCDRSELSDTLGSPSLDCTFLEFKEFHDSLEIGERVIELGESGMKGETGTVKQGRNGKVVEWDTDFNGARMTTAVTGGTRRIS